MTVDLVDELRSGIKLVTENLFSPTPESPDIIQDTLEKLTDLMDEMGMPGIFFQIGGADLLIALLDYEPGYTQTGLLIANLVQNEQGQQQFALSKDLLALSLDRLAKSVNDPEALRGLVSAVSGKSITCIYSYVSATN